MVNKLDKRALGAKKGGIEKSIITLQEAGKPVPKGKQEELERLNKEMARIDEGSLKQKGDEGSSKQGTSKKGTSNQSTPQQGASQQKASQKAKATSKVKAELKDESLFQDDYSSSHKGKKHKRKKTMLSNELDFEPMGDSSKALSAVIATPKQGSSYEETIQLPLVVHLADGKTFEIEADQKRSEQDKSFWAKVQDTWPNFSFLWEKLMRLPTRWTRLS